MCASSVAGRVPRGNGGVADQRGVEHAAQRVDVGARVDALRRCSCSGAEKSIVPIHWPVSVSCVSEASSRVSPKSLR